MPQELTLLLSFLLYQAALFLLIGQNISLAWVLARMPGLVPSIWDWIGFFASISVAGSALARLWTQLVLYESTPTNGEWVTKFFYLSAAVFLSVVLSCYIQRRSFIRLEERLREQCA